MPLPGLPAAPLPAVAGLPGMPNPAAGALMSGAAAGLSPANLAAIQQQQLQAKQAQQQLLQSQQTFAQNQAKQKLPIFLAAARANPALLNTPAAQQMAQTLGLPPGTPLTMDMLEELGPGKDWTEMSQQERASVIAAPPESRPGLLAGVKNVPPEVYTAKRYVPLSAGAEQHVFSGFDDKLKAVSMDQMTPAAFVSYIKDNRDNLEAVGKSPASYLSPDGNSLSDSLKAQIGSQYATAVIDKMKKLGLAAASRASTAQKLEDEKVREFNTMLPLKKQALAIKSEQVQGQLSLASQRLGVMMQNAQTSSGRLQIAAYVAKNSLPMKLYLDAVNQRDANLRSMEAAGDNVDGDLVNSTSALNDIVEQMGLQLDTAKGLVRSGVANHLENASGIKTTVPGQQPSGSSLSMPAGAKPKFHPPPQLPPGAKYVGPGPKGGDEYQFPDGKKREWLGP